MCRDYSISILRVTATLMIVLYHCLAFNAGVWGSFDNPIVYNQYALPVIYNIAYVALDIFVLISGVLYYRIGKTGKYDDVRSFLGGKARRLLVPYIVWGVVVCLLFYGHEKPTELLSGISHLWFLLMLFDVFIIAALSRKLWDKLNLKQSVFCFLLLLPVESIVVKTCLVLSGGEWAPPFAIPAALSYLPLFYLGMITEKFQLYDRFHFAKGISCLFVAALYVIGASVYYFHPAFPFLYQWLPAYLLFVVAYSSMRTSLSPVGGGKSWDAVSLLDKYSLSIYILHHILIFLYLYYVPNGQGFMTQHHIVAPLLLFIAVSALSLLLSYTLSYMPCAQYVIGTRGSKK